MRSSSSRPALDRGRAILIGALLSAAPLAPSASGEGGVALESPAAVAQALSDRIVDRWLVTAVPAAALDSAYPLDIEGERVFPDRQEELGPGYWDLARAGSPDAGVSLAALSGAGEAALAHVYLKAPVDGDLVLGLREPECDGASLWLNGQAVPLAGERPVRLAAGWNTVLLGLPGDCGRDLTVELTRSEGPAERGTHPLEPSRLRLQASRPPGVGPNYPAPVVALGTPRPTGLVWRAGSDRLGARIEYGLTAWGARGMDGETAGRGLRERRDEPPGPPGPEARPPGFPPRGAREAPEGEDEETGPSAERRSRFEAMASQLLPPAPPPPPAPRSASVELDIDGTDLTGGAEDLTPAVPARLEGEIPFEDARDAALDEKGVEATISWSGGEREVVGPLRADEVLEALHAPIALLATEGTFRVPDALDGFTLRVLDGEWSVDGRPVEDGVLCRPCERGRRLEIRVTGTTEARVQIADPGYPQAHAAGAGPDAVEWLRALKRGGRIYRELGEEAARP